MKRTGLLGTLCGIMLSMVLVTGCATGPAGQTRPDYAGIELGSVVAMTVIVNEVKSSQATVNLAYERMATLHASLSCVDTGTQVCPPYNLKVLPQMVANALPVEYAALGPAMISYIESKARLYYNVEVPLDPANMEMVRKITVVVIGGALQALAPHVSK